MPQNGWRSVSVSQRSTPTDQTSLCGVASPPSKRSGAMYASVPGTSPTAVSVSAPSNWASPKSRSRTATSSRSSSRMFAGFTSRWTIAARYVLVRDVDVARVVADVVRTDTSVVTEAAGGERLALGTRCGLAFARDDLQSDVEAVLLVEREPDRARTSGSERSHGPVAPEHELLS